MKILVFLILLTGCAGIEYNAQTGVFKYWRIGDQKIEGLTVQKSDLDVSLDEQTAKNDQISEILNIVRQLLEKYPL